MEITPEMLWVVAVFAFFLGCLFRDDFVKARQEYFEGKARKEVVRQNSPSENLKLMRACIVEMRRDYRLLPADRFVREMLQWCDQLESEVLDKLREEEASGSAQNARREAARL